MKNTYISVSVPVHVPVHCVDYRKLKPTLSFPHSLVSCERSGGFWKMVVQPKCKTVKVQVSNV